MADFRRWILALAVVALLAGLTIPASAQIIQNSSVPQCTPSGTQAPIVRAEGLAELVGDLVLYCVGGSPTTPGRQVPQVNITVYLNTNITSKVLGTQINSFGNGQTAGLDEALLLIDEPNSPNSPGVQCAGKGTWNGSNFAQNVCLGTTTTGVGGTVTAFSTNGNPYPILNCGAVVGVALVAPDGGSSGPGVCSIIAAAGPTGGPAPEHTYDGVFAGGAYPSGAPPAANVYPPSGTFPDACQINNNIATPTGTVTQGSLLVAGVSAPAPAANWIGGGIAGAGIPAGTTIVAVSGSTVQMSNAATVSSAGPEALTITFTTSVGTIGTFGNPGYNCGRPNVFQGRMGALQNPNQYNAVTFLGVPMDPPGSAIGRTLRFTNFRANAAQLGVSSTFTTQQILMNISIPGWNVSQPQQIVGYVNKGLNPAVGVAPSNLNANGISGNTFSFFQSGGAIFLPGGTGKTGLAPNVPGIGEFVQCIAQNPDLYAFGANTIAAPNFVVPQYLGAGNAFAGGFNCPGGGDCNPLTASADITPTIRFYEGFAAAWKTKNISFTVGSGVASPGQGGNATFAANTGYLYNGNRNYPADVPQNVPGTVYYTEAGITYPSALSTIFGPPPSPNPPLGFQTNADILSGGVPNQGVPFSDDWAGSSNATGIAGAGIANQGTRLYLSFGNIPAGASLWTPPVIYLFRQGVTNNGDPATLGNNPLTGVPQAQATGVMVLTVTDGAGAGGFLRAQSINPFQLTKVGATGLAVYEILYADPLSAEYADVPVVLAYASNPGQNLPAPAPPNPNTTVTGGFAPFYTSAASTQPSPNGTFQTPTLPVPRFIPGTAFDFINIQKCSCNILFPFVASALGYDTGLAIANTSQDPGNTYGFLATPQPGTVQLWYYGDMDKGQAVPGPQTSSAVQPGHVLTYVLSTGSTQYGLDGRAAGLTGYMIAQAQFQYCHAYAFISAIGAGPTSPGTSEGYLGIILDRDGLPRTISIGENKAH